MKRTLTVACAAIAAAADLALPDEVQGVLWIDPVLGPIQSVAPALSRRIAAVCLRPVLAVCDDVATVFAAIASI